MKQKSNHYFLLFLAAAILSLNACYNPEQYESKNKIEGVWKLVSYQPPGPDGTIVKNDTDWQMMKIYTESHFMFTEQAPGRPLITNGENQEELSKAAKAFFGGAGTYTMDNDSTYTEHIKIFLTPNYIDVKVTWKCTFYSENLWSQEGYLPAKAVGIANEDYHIFELYERVE